MRVSDRRWSGFGRVAVWALVLAWAAGCEPIEGGGGGLGGRLAVIRDGALHVSDSDGSLDQTLTESNTSSDPAISGSTVAFFYEPEIGSGDRGLYLVTTAGGTPELVRSADEGITFESPAWTPDGSAISYVERNGATRTLKQVPRGGGIGPSIELAGYSPKYVTHVSATEIVIVDATTNEIVRIDNGVATATGKHTVSRVAVSPDGTSIAYADADAQDQLKVQVLSTGVETALAVQSSATAQPCFSPDGRYVAFEVTTTGSLVYALPADGTDALEGPLTTGTDVAWGN